MDYSDFDLIYGIHSIVSAINNPLREILAIYSTSEGLSELKKQRTINLDKIGPNKLFNCGPHQLQEKAKSLIKKDGQNFQRVPNGIFLIVSKLPILGPEVVYKAIEDGRKVRLICLDQVTDAHNLAAISRSASFYGLDFLIISRKGDFRLSPTFYRISSGSLEVIKIVKCTNLSKLVLGLQKRGVFCLGLSENSPKFEIDIMKIESDNKGICLVLGSEERGISHAVKRILTNNFSLSSVGKIKTLNVSVAAAIGLEKLFGPS
jgi:23S rRNA (guanosine2251-2'-O)-methyltransferase